MKKLLLYLSILSITLFLFININLNAKTTKNNKYTYAQNYHNIKFKNLNSKNLNSLFKDLHGTIISIEVETLVFTKKYKFHTAMTTDVEKELMIKVVKDLEELNKRELATEYKINGIKIKSMDILCNFEELEIIKSRVETE